MIIFKLNLILDDIGQKLNFRFKDFSQKKRHLNDNNSSLMINHILQSDEKSKIPMLQVKTSGHEYNNGDLRKINAVDYKTNSSVVHPKNDKVLNSLFKINKRRLE